MAEIIFAVIMVMIVCIVDMSAFTLDKETEKLLYYDREQFAEERELDEPESEKLESEDLGPEDLKQEEELEAEELKQKNSNHEQYTERKQSVTNKSYENKFQSHNNSAALMGEFENILKKMTGEEMHEMRGSLKVSGDTGKHRARGKMSEMPNPDIAALADEFLDDVYSEVGGGIAK